MKRTVAFVCVTAGIAASCALVNVAGAAEVTFPSAGGNLSSGWGTPPETSDTVVISQGGDYDASGDLSFGNIKVTTSGNVTFDMSGKRVALNNAKTGTGLHYPGTYGYGFAPLISANASISINGGLWDLVNGNNFYAASSGTGNTGGNVTISGGAVITNVYRFYYGEHSRGNTVVLDNAKVYAVELNNWATGDHNLLDIRNGAEMHLSGFFETDNAGDAAATTGFNEIRVSGTGSRLNVTGSATASKIGTKHQSNTLRIANGAKLDMAGTLSMGTSNAQGASNNLFVVENCATANVVTVTAGAVNPSKGSRVEILSGSVANFTTLSVGTGGETSFSKVMVSNATLNVNTLNFPNAWSSRSNEFWLINGAVLGGSALNTRLMIQKSYGNKFCVSKSSLVFPYLFLGGDSGAYGGNGFCLLDGAAATNTAVSTLGQTTECNYMVVSNSTWKTPGFYLGSSASRNWMLADNGARIHVTTSTGAILGNAAAASSNRFDIAGGSLMYMDNTAAGLTIGSSGSFNEAMVRESCVTCGYVSVGANAGSTGNKLAFKDSVFAAIRSGTAYNSDPFGSGHGNEFILDNTDWNLGSEYLSVSRTGSNNVFRLLNGTTLKATVKTFAIGGTSRDSIGNVFYVGDGCVADLIRLRMMCLDSTVIVSNGTVQASESMDFAYRETNVNDFSAGNTLRLEGDRPVISCSGTVKFQRSAALVAALPKDKFAKGHVPIQAANLTFDSTSRIKVEGDDFFAKTGGTVVLAEVTGSITLPAAAITASLADMPAGCRLYVSGKKLIFRAPSMKGFCIGIR